MNPATTPTYRWYMTSWLSFLNLAAIGLLIFLMNKQRKYLNEVRQTNHALAHQLAYTTTLASTLLDRSVGMITCDECGGALRATHVIAVSLDGTRITHAECVLT